jgi:hypothetical protein
MKDVNINYWAYFGDLYMGVIIAENYNPYIKRNILTLKTNAGTVTKIRDPRGEVTKWHLKPCN